MSIKNYPTPAHFALTLNTATADKSYVQPFFKNDNTK
jgi:hypothetical protein